MSAIVADGLAKKFGKVEAVKDASFSVNEGEIFGFLGPNGAGKTTTINMLCTLLRPTSGGATVNGWDVARSKSEVRRSIGLVFQDTTLDDYLSAEQNLRFHAYAYGIPREQFEGRMRDLLTMFELWDRRKDKVRTYSGGMKRRLELARGLLHRPRVLFLDEPTLGLDPQTRRKIWEYILDMKRKHKLTIILTTHYMEEAEALCDRVAIIDYGKIIALDTPRKLKHILGGDVITLTLSENCNKEKAKKTLEGMKIIRKMKCINSQINMSVSSAERAIPEVLRKMDKKGLKVVSVETHEPTLEDVFIHYTGRTIREERASATDRMRLRRMRRMGHA